MGTDAADAVLKAVNGTKPKTFVFVFPLASGHVNPALPVARQLVELGHRVHFICFEQLREAIEGTGASFHSAIDVEPELYKGRKPDAWGALTTLMEEYGIKDFMFGTWALRIVMNELQLPGVLRFLKQVEADATVFCPLFNWEVTLAAKVLSIPAIGILTTGGPGVAVSVWSGRLKNKGLTFEAFDRMVAEFEPAQKARERLSAQYGLDLKAGLSKPFGLFDSMAMSALTLVTTSEDLQEPAPPELMEAYKAAGADFQYVGPLLDVAGARRGGTHLENGAAEAAPTRDTDLVQLVRAARKAGRQVVLVSMGTVVTSDNPLQGWTARPVGADGRPRGLTGCQLCRAAWAGTFDAFAAERADDGPLLVVALGAQPDALGDVVPPPNAVCAPSLPQVDLLKEDVQLFLTHGGQNSFMESLFYGTPVVVCPGFGDQVLNSQRAVELGFGLKVDRPDPEPGSEEAAVAAYRQEVCKAVATVLREETYANTAKGHAERLAKAGGVERAVQLVLKVTEGGR